MSTTVLVIGLVVAMAGKVLLGYTVMVVHTRIMKEHRIDDVVVNEIKKERRIALWGIVLIIVGTILEVSFYLSPPF